MNWSNTDFHLPYNRQLVEKAKELRKNMTPAERKLWSGYLRTFKFRILRQRPINNFIVDFFCAQLRLVIEVDRVILRMMARIMTGKERRF
jgi:very-short-patch-repair endonuclease